MRIGRLVLPAARLRIFGVTVGVTVCLLCKRPFFFDPNAIPLVNLKEMREDEAAAVCYACVRKANRVRLMLGLEPWCLPGEEAL